VIDDMSRDDLVLRGFFPECVIEIGVERAVDLVERVEVAVAEFTVIISDVTCDHQEELERKHGGWHHNRIGVVRNAWRSATGISVEERV
jgi:hypothetical protein